MFSVIVKDYKVVDHLQINFVKKNGKQIVVYYSINNVNVVKEVLIVDIYYFIGNDFDLQLIKELKVEVDLFIFIIFVDMCFDYVYVDIKNY